MGVEKVFSRRICCVSVGGGGGGGGREGRGNEKFKKKKLNCLKSIYIKIFSEYF